MLQAVAEALSGAGIDLPFPTQVVLFHDQTETTDGDSTRQREGWPAGDAAPSPRLVRRVELVRAEGKALRTDGARVRNRGRQWEPFAIGSSGTPSSFVARRPRWLTRPQAQVCTQPRDFRLQPGDSFRASHVRFVRVGVATDEVGRQRCRDVPENAKRV